MVRGGAKIEAVVGVYECDSISRESRVAGTTLDRLDAIKEGKRHTACANWPPRTEWGAL